ncbi:rod shape-determining protein RodA [Agaribacter marinus]|uniref:Peptidoglycan glycosyltransferase MrdB n=1 Tax=Agaribacter marinus TaxID=1431249 RepID=A0AA37SWM8_9ALTE|nr:rod shape-determining protein RodA [Agaribacter marinus]GLR70492.1 rod shape-determining protein RodA [Agaribacter marinus]
MAANNKSKIKSNKATFLERIHIDGFLLFSLMSLMVVGLLTIYSSGGQEQELVNRQLVRLGLAVGVMIGLAQVPIMFYRRIAIYAYSLGVFMLIAVLLFGDIGKGAQRWLDLGFIRFQPSEIMKLAVPLMLAMFISRKTLPPNFGNIAIGFALVFVPTILIAKQPDLGTSLLVASSGIFVLFLAGMSWRLIGFIGALGVTFAPIMWFFLMKEYQKQRVITFLNPESDPLGSGYHIIQSKIAIGSGGVEGKGWLQGTQSQLEFLPERHTDFIFAVFSEEFGLIGVFGLLIMYMCIILRGLHIANRAQDAFSKLLAGSITLTFFVYVFVNMGMVSGLLPVVGVPLPLISYGGTSMVTLLAGFGILMSISTQRRLLSRAT